MKEIVMMLRGMVQSWMFAAAALTGCAGHAAMRGSVVMKIDPTTAHVCLGSGEVAVNDRVRLYKNTCESKDRRSVCTKTTIADGTVMQLLDQHYSVVAFPAGTPFEEGNTVEKL
jgi:hypothetical protein